MNKTQTKTEANNISFDGNFYLISGEPAVSGTFVSVPKSIQPLNYIGELQQSNTFASEQIMSHILNDSETDEWTDASSASQQQSERIQNADIVNGHIVAQHDANIECEVSTDHDSIRITLPRGMFDFPTTVGAPILVGIRFENNIKTPFVRQRERSPDEMLPEGIRNADIDKFISEF